MDVLYALQGIRSPALDMLLSLITQLGEETILLGVGMILFWCVNKKFGMQLFYIGVLGGIANQLLKALFLIPRPWVMDPNFPIVESARAAATGYSFPSGHTQSAATLFGSLAQYFKKRWMWVCAVVLTLLVGFSRMYLGVHTPLDVGVSLLTGAALILLFGRLFRIAATNPRMLYALGVGGVLFGIIAVLYTTFAPVTPHNVASFDSEVLENCYSMLGGMLGIVCIYLADKKWLHFPVEAAWWVQIIKCVVGLGLVMAVRLLLKTPIDTLFNDHAFAKCVRYFLMAVTGGTLWPLTFPWFSRLGRRK